MNCKNKTKKSSATISQDEAVALYNAIDLQLLKEAPISKSDAQALVKTLPVPGALPKANVLSTLDNINNPAFAKMLLYSFIPDKAPELLENPEVATKRAEQLKIVDFITNKTQVDRSYVQKHLRNVLVSGYNKTPEDLLQEVSTGKGMGFDPVTLFTVGSTVYGVFDKLFGGPPEDTSDTGWQNFLRTVDRGTIFPTKEEMIQAAQQSGWDRAEPEAIAKSYDESTGNWNRGDWRFSVTGLTPIEAKAFKGANEAFPYYSKLNSRALERAYAKKTTPAPSDWQTKPGQNVTNDPTKKDNGTDDKKGSWYQNPWIIGGIVIGTGAVAYGGYTLLSDNK